MVLCDADRDLFYTLNRHLLFYASEQLEFLPRPALPLRDVNTVCVQVEPR
jgi:hypothetical protein